jgi:FKBP-type peptidyl-prolyl cis-trans isomerase FkpA
MPRPHSSPSAASAILATLLVLGVSAALAAQPEPFEKLAKDGARVEIVTASGLRYTDLKIGQGQEAAEGKIVEVHYTGWLADGKKFDSTHDCPRPLTFRMGTSDMIKGLNEGISGMREGGKRRLVIPPELGFGKQGGGGVIPPNATLIYEVELLSIR